MVRIAFLLASLVAFTSAIPTPKNDQSIDKSKFQEYATNDQFPLPNIGHVTTHDPSVIFHDDYFHVFGSGHHIPWHKSKSMSGPWQDMGTVLSNRSVIHAGSRSAPWAPTVIYRNGKLYCFYSVSNAGSDDSAIGVASTDKLDGVPWEDHGALIHTGSGKGADVFPFNETNAIDPSFVEDQVTKKPYLNFGSYWAGIWQIPLSDDLLSIESPDKPDAVQLTHIDKKGKLGGPQEGSWMNYHDGWYYTWFSQGVCCVFKHGLPPKGDEYHVRVGRSKGVRGPFVDRDGKSLTEGGGTTVYASNHGDVYAPGGSGVLTGNATVPDIFYYHYLNQTTEFHKAQLGWNYLKYEDGWPVAVAGEDKSKITGIPSEKPSDWTGCTTPECVQHYFFS